MRFHERTDRHDFHHRFQELVREPPRNECSQLMRTMGDGAHLSYRLVIALAYGGDLRQDEFTEQLFELVIRATRHVCSRQHPCRSREVRTDSCYCKVDHSQTRFVSVPQFAIFVGHYNRPLRSSSGRGLRQHARRALVGRPASSSRSWPASGCGPRSRSTLPTRTRICCR